LRLQFLHLSEEFAPAAFGRATRISMGSAHTGLGGWFSRPLLGAVKVCKKIGLDNIDHLVFESNRRKQPKHQGGR